MRTILRTFLRLLFWLTTLPVALYLLLLLGNLEDEPLLPEVERLVHDQPPTVPVEDNGYFAWIGIMGSAQHPPYAWGLQWIQAVSERERTLNGKEPFGHFPLQKEVRTDTLAKEEPFCRDIESCLENTAAAPHKAKVLLDQHRMILDRADQALNYPAYREAWRPHVTLRSPLPAYPYAWRPLAAMRFALAVSEGRHDQALDTLHREMSFHRLQMEGAFSLMEKMVSISNLASRFSLLAQYLRLYPQEARQRIDLIQTLLVPLPKEAISLRGSIREEQRLMTRHILTSKQRSSPFDAHRLSDWIKGQLLSPLILPYTSANELARLTAPWIQAEEASGPEYRQALGLLAQNIRQPQALLTWRNPCGHILTLIAKPDYEKYQRKRDNLLALQHLVAFQARLVQQGKMDEAAISSMLTTADAQWEHPSLGTRMVWDKTQRQLSFPVTEGAPFAQDAKPVAIQL